MPSTKETSESLGDVLAEVLKFDCPLVEITGGEPLLQKNVLPLMSTLADAGQTVLLETSGAHDISRVDPRVHRIVDLKTPGSGEVERNLWSNMEHLTRRDEVKCVIGSREDYEWSREKVQRLDLPSRCRAVLFSPIFGRIDPREIVEWILADNLRVRFQLQMHKFIWKPAQARSLIIRVPRHARPPDQRFHSSKPPRLCRVRPTATNAAGCTGTASKSKFPSKARSIRRSAGSTITPRSARP